MTSTKVTQAGKKNWWPTGIVASLIAFVAFMLAIVTATSRLSSDVVSHTYYQDGYNLKQVLAEKAKTAATGWTVTVATAGGSEALVMVMDASGMPRDSLIGEVGFYRPSDARLDVATQSIKPKGGGIYGVPLPRPLEAGSWQAKVQLTHGRDVYEKSVSFFVD
jgi:nitrogen fixation protein FixH